MSEYSYVDTYLEPLSIVESFSEQKQEMLTSELGFLCGLIKEHQPKKIVEVGVAAGGTTAVLLHCVELLGLPSQIYSVDVSKIYYWDEWSGVSNPKKTGFLLNELENIPKMNHKLLLGKVLPDRLQEIGKDIDFLILDTMHILPGEVLDFLAAFPYLKKNAIVVVHDISCHTISWQSYTTFATCVLFQTVSAKKMLNNKEGYPNIAAFQLDESTGENIEDVFNALMLPWEYMLQEEWLLSYEKVFSQFYSDGCMKLYRQILKSSLQLYADRNRKLIGMYFEALGDSLFNSFKYVLLYGAGYRGKVFLEMACKYGIQIKGFVVSDEVEIESSGKEIPIFHYSEIPFERESVLIVQTANSKEIEERMHSSKYHWIKVPNVIWQQLI